MTRPLGLRTTGGVVGADGVARRVLPEAPAPASLPWVGDYVGQDLCRAEAALDVPGRDAPVVIVCVSSAGHSGRHRPWSGTWE